MQEMQYEESLELNEENKEVAIEEQITEEDIELESDEDADAIEEQEEVETEEISEPQKEITIDPTVDLKDFIHENPEDIDLKGIREHFGFTFEQVAEGIGITDNYYRKVERKWTGLTENIASKLSQFYGFEILPYTIKSQPKEKPIKNEEIQNQSITKKVIDTPEKRLHLALKKKHSELANKIVARYEAINVMKEMINDIFLKDGE